MKFKIDGRELDVVDNPRIREAAEAEKALGMDMEDGFTARLAISIFVALRRDDPEKSARDLGDEVMNMDLASLEEVEEELPPAEEPAAEAGEPESPPTTGPLRSVQSA
jgi:hypothetical protein